MLNLPLDIGRVSMTRIGDGSHANAGRTKLVERLALDRGHLYEYSGVFDDDIGRRRLGRVRTGEIEVPRRRVLPVRRIGTAQPDEGIGDAGPLDQDLLRLQQQIHVELED